MSAASVVPINQSPTPAPEVYGPNYVLRLEVPENGRGGSSQWRLEIWQKPAPATPRLRTPEHVATVKGAALRLVEHRVLKRLRRARVNLGVLRPGKKKEWNLDEDLALTLALLFRALAPMRNLDRIRDVAEGVEGMSREEAGYWLGMAIHRPRPRRVLAALRMLLTSPSR